MYQEESIYNLLPKDKVLIEKQALFRFLYSPKIVPTASRFCLKTKSFPNKANLNEEYSYPR